MGPIFSWPKTPIAQRVAQERGRLLATLDTHAQLFRDVEELRWQGPTPAFLNAQAKASG